jgi:hypothetical protein
VQEFVSRKTKSRSPFKISHLDNVPFNRVEPYICFLTSVTRVFGIITSIVNELLAIGSLGLSPDPSLESLPLSVSNH